MRKIPTILRFMIWRLKNINERLYILILSLFIGLAAGIGTVILKSVVYFVKQVLVRGFTKEYFNVLFFVYPLIGIFVVILMMKYLFNQKPNHGIVSTLFAIGKRKSIMNTKTIFSSLFASAITIGFGGSAGIEGPAVASSSSIGSFVGRKLRLNYKQTTLLLACGAAGAMASSLNAPITGLIFTLEILMLDLTTFSIIPLLTASVSGALMTRFIYGSDYLFNLNISPEYDMTDMFFYLSLGLFTGFVSIYFERMFWFIEELLSNIKNDYRRFIVGGVALGALIFLIPPLFGEGYGIINSLLAGNLQDIVNHSPLFAHRENVIFLIILLLFIAFTKVIATSLTMAAGGVGGVVAPSLFIGASIGFVFSKSVNLLTNYDLNETNFTLVGMAGVFAGILHAPLTAIFLIAELTGGYALMLPLMAVVVLSYITVKIFIPHSIYNMQLAKRKELMTHHKDKAILLNMNISDVIETDFVKILPNAPLGEIIDAVKKSHRNVFPVVTESGQLAGILYLDKIRNVMFNTSLYDKIFVENVMISAATYISMDDDMETVMDKFSKSRAWNLPVLENGLYKGFLSRSVVLTEYRKKVVEISEE